MKNQRNIKLSLVRASIFVYVLLGTPFLVQAAPLDPEKVSVALILIASGLGVLFSISQAISSCCWLASKIFCQTRSDTCQR
jgi:hypothetical protein